MVRSFRHFAVVLLMLASGLATPGGGADAGLPAASRTPQQYYDQVESKQMESLLSQVLRFPTVAGNSVARARQQAWLKKTAEQMGFIVRDAGPVIEVELPGPAGGPVLGLVVHGDVQPVDEDAWSFPPFAGQIRKGTVCGRGAADDKGPLVQALLAMKALREAGGPRTHTIRLLVGSDEESSNKDISTYLEMHRAPDYSLVLDSSFPVVVGEKAWNALVLTTDIRERETRELGARPYILKSLDGGVSASIVPDRAKVILRWIGGAPNWEPFAQRIMHEPVPNGIRITAEPEGWEMEVTAYGKAAHSGVNLEGGRNALVALAGVMMDYLPASGGGDLLAFVRQAGRDLYGAGLRLNESDPLWGRILVNIATIKPLDEHHAALTINIRSFPPMTGARLRARLEQVVYNFNLHRGSQLEFSGYFDDTALVINPRAKLVQRLMADYQRATGERASPVVSGGGTYAKRLPNAIAFGMWFPGTPYPGHDVDEAVPVASLHRGVHVLLEALLDIACSPRIDHPLEP